MFVKLEFCKLTEALRLWTRRNPVDSTKTEEPNPLSKKERRQYHFQTQQVPRKTKQLCVYCNGDNHRSSECGVVVTNDERKKLLASKKLFFSCTGPSHRASECKSASSCKLCSKRHHTSICNTPKEFDSKPKVEPLLTADKPADQEVIYPTVIVEIDGNKTRALLDTGAGGSYASNKLINALKKKPKEVKTKTIEMMLGSTTARTEIYLANLKSLDGKFSLDIEPTKVDKPELMSVKNPKYEELLEKHAYLKGAVFEDSDERSQVPVHIVLGIKEYAAIKTTTAQKVGLPGQPVAERTQLGWTVLSPGIQGVDNPLLLTKSASSDYEQLCALDVLGLADTNENDQQTGYHEFTEQLKRSEAGWYEAKLPWKGNHPPLPTNETGSKRRLEQLIKKLERNNQYIEYEDIIQEQLSTGVIETAPVNPTGKVFYIPHKGVTRSDSESTKLRIVFDASARESNQDPSLNDCLHPGPPLQNLLWSILVKARSYPILLTGDLKKAFLQVRIAAEERDSLRFHWRHPNASQINVYRFARALFGLTCSPFLLRGVLMQHLNSWEDHYPELVCELREGLYVDDLASGGVTIQETQQKIENLTQIFEDATFTVHKWRSNAPELEETNEVPTRLDLTYAKSQLGGMIQPKGKLSACHGTDNKIHGALPVQKKLAL